MKSIRITPRTKATELGGIPPKPASNYLPEWYKNIGPFTNSDKKLRFPMGSPGPNLTIKRCVPFLDAMTAGYTFVLDDDILVEQTLAGPTLRWKSDAELISWHSLEQFSGLPIGKGYHTMVAKWANDFAINTPKEFSLLCTHPINRLDLPFFTLTGLVDTDKYDHPIQFPFLLKEGFEGIIESGTPVAQLLPVKRESWKTKEIPYDADNSYKALREFSRTLISSYKKNYWVKKEYE